MREQAAIRAKSHGEWTFINESDDDEPERAWQSYDAAIEEVRREGWHAIEGPGGFGAHTPLIAARVG